MLKPRFPLIRICVFVLIGFAGIARADQWQAGSAKVNITPEKLMWMAGYGGRDHPAEGKLTDLWAKAMVLDDGAKHRAVLITLDLVGIDRELSQQICKRLETKYGFERDQVAICTSHTHTGPVVGRNLRPMHYETIDDEQKALVDQYAATLAEKVESVVGQALRNLGPSVLTHGSGIATFAVNRRNNSESAVPELRIEGKLAGPFDHDVPVLAVKDLEGELKTVVFGYACHSTVLGIYQWSGDYAGFAQIELEKAHSGCVAMFWAGCGADQNPLPRRTVELAKEYGAQLAGAVNEVLAKKMATVSPSLETMYREVDLPLDTLPTREEIEQDAESTNKYVAARARMFLADIAAGHPLPRSYPYPVQVWTLGGEIDVVTLGGEVVIDYALRLKSELNGRNTWVAGYANDVMAYIPSRRVLREGGYEGATAMIYYGLPTRWSPEVEKLIVDEVHRQVRSLKE